MKKLLTILMSLTLLLTIAACGNKEKTAQTATTKVLTTIKELDVINANKYFEVENIKEQDIELDIDFIFEELDGEELEYAKLIVKHFDFKVLDSKEAGNNATVKIELTNADMKAVFAAYFEYAFEIVFTETDEEVIEEKLEEKLIELLDNDDVNLKTTEVDMDLYKVDNDWKIDLSDAALDAMLGGLISIGEQFED